MKTKLKILVLAFSIVIFMAGAPRVGAFPYIEVEGGVSPDYSTFTDNGDGTVTFGQIDYFFTVTGTFLGAEMDYLSLEFEDEVFKSPVSLSIFGLDPVDWTISSMPSPTGSIYYEASAGTTLGLWEKLSFTVKNAVVYDQALSDPSLWQENQIWAQSWTAGDTLGGGDGGSTAVPEPATLLLLGSGLAGLGLFGWRRSRTRT